MCCAAPIWSGCSRANRSDYADTGANDPAYLVYTSGTTSRPKGVLHAHRAAWARRIMYPHWMGLTRDDAMLHAGAINWTYTLGVGVVDPLASGARAILYNGRPDPAIWPRLIERHGATIFAAVPGVYRQILKTGALEAHDISTLRHGLSAGAALAPSLLAEWRERTGKEIFEAYGMSEISTFVSSGPTTPARPGSPGRPQPGRQIAVLPRENGTTPLPAGETGLLAMRRDEPGLMLGYWNRPDEEKEALRGEWFVSGDLVEIDAEGYVWLHGRADEVMNAGGYRVSPAEVERCLAGYPGIAEAAVAERPGRDAGNDDHQGLCGRAERRGVGRSGDSRALRAPSRGLQMPPRGAGVGAPCRATPMASSPERPCPEAAGATVFSSLATRPIAP